MGVERFERFELLERVLDRSNLRLQYLAGRGLNLYRADDIYAAMLGHAREPTGIFTGSDHLKHQLMERIMQAWGR